MQDVCDEFYSFAWLLRKSLCQDSAYQSPLTESHLAWRGICSHAIMRLILLAGPIAAAKRSRDVPTMAASAWDATGKGQNAKAS